MNSDVKKKINKQDTSPEEVIQDKVPKEQSVGVVPSGEQEKQVVSKEDSSQFFILPPEEKKTNDIKFFLMIFFLTLVISGIFFLIYDMQKKRIDITLSPELSTPSPQAIKISPTATPVPSIDDQRDTYSITILNGTSKSGEASKLKTFLEEKGFHIGSIGNTSVPIDSSTFLSVKTGTNTVFINNLELVLKQQYTLAKRSTSADSQTEDVVITIGN